MQLTGLGDHVVQDRLQVVALEFVQGDIGAGAVHRTQPASADDSVERQKLGQVDFVVPGVVFLLPSGELGKLSTYMIPLAMVAAFL